MAGFSPFVGQVIRPEFVRRVPAPAFDSMSAADRIDYLRSHPESYTLVTRSPGDGGPEDDASSDRLIELGGEALQRIIDSGAFLSVGEPAFFLLRLSIDGHTQTGIVGLVDSQDYLDGHLKRHEQVSADRALHLSRHFEALAAQSSPIAFGYRSDDMVIDRIEQIVATNEPIVSFVSGDGLGQDVWVVTNTDDVDLFQKTVAERELYIMDGHHRAAAAGELLKRCGPGSASHMLGVLFASAHLHVEPFHRRVTIAPELDQSSIHEQLVAALQLVRDESMSESLPEDEAGVGVWSNGTWWRGTLPKVGDGPLGAIDPVKLQRGVLGPIFEIDPKQPAGRIGYFLEGANRAALAATASANEVLFVLRAVTPDQVFAVADAGEDMPPKSTYVTPKPRSGVFLRRL